MRERVRASKSNTFRGINVQTSPGISKGVPDSKLFKSTVQSGDTSVRISNSDRIDRPAATAGGGKRTGGVKMWAASAEEEGERGGEVK